MKSLTSFGTILFLLFLGAVLFLFKDSNFPPPFKRALCHLNRVGLETLKASLVAKSPYFSQKARIRHLSFACSVIIYRKRIILSQPEINPLVSLNLLN